MIVDIHNHTAPHSPDARQSLDELVASARQAGLYGIMVTEHVEPDYPDPLAPDPVLSALYDMEEAARTLARVRASLPDDGFLVLSGLEFGWMPHLGLRMADMVRSAPFDGILLSMHVLRGHDPYFDSTIFHASRRTLCREWMAHQAAMAREAPDFDILGHYDYFSRYAPWEDPRLRYDDAPDEMEAFLSALAARGAALELNTRTVLRMEALGVADPLPDRRILERFRELGGERVCIGSDSHEPGVHGKKVPDILGRMAECGFRHVCHYVGREVRFLPIP